MFFLILSHLEIILYRIISGCGIIGNNMGNTVPILAQCRLHIYSTSCTRFCLALCGPIAVVSIEVCLTFITGVLSNGVVGSMPVIH